MAWMKFDEMLSQETHTLAKSNLGGGKFVPVRMLIGKFGQMINYLIKDLFN